MSDRGLIAGVAAVTIATVAIGLRVGAGETVRAAIVMGAPLPEGGGRAVFQLRTQEDDGRTRTAVSSPFLATIRASGVEKKIEGTTNVDGVAELAFDAPGLAAGDPIEFDVRDDRGGVLARGAGVWPSPMPVDAVLDRQTLRASRSEGALPMHVALDRGALAPGEPGRAWVTIASNGAEPPRDVRVDATPDLGIEVVRPFTKGTCGGAIYLVARGMNGGLALHAKDALGREGDWYGAIPVAPGALEVDAKPIAPLGPMRVVVTSSGAGRLAYVEVNDDRGRAEAAVLALAGEPPRAETTFDLRTPGRHFLVLSGSPDGATNVEGATRALPFWVGENAPCEAEIAAFAGRAFPRFVMLDGFALERTRLAKRKRKGRFIALGAIALGSLVETLVLLRAARAGRRAPTAKRSPLNLLVVLGVSLLGFALLFALVAAFAAK